MNKKLLTKTPQGVELEVDIDFLRKLFDSELFDIVMMIRNHMSITQVLDDGDRIHIYRYNQVLIIRVHSRWMIYKFFVQLESNQ